jgi:hypothetical protein
VVQRPLAGDLKGGKRLANQRAARRWDRRGILWARLCSGGSCTCWMALVMTPVAGQSREGEMVLHHLFLRKVMKEPVHCRELMPKKM